MPVRRDALYESAREKAMVSCAMFGSQGTKVGKRVVAMDVKGRLVVKRSPERAAVLRDAGLAEAFDPGHGRPMKQWVAVGPSARFDWLALARETLAVARG